MFREMAKSKIHRATITEANLNYKGSITIDERLCRAADLLPGEKVTVIDLENGERFDTYVIVGEKNSGTICVNGGAARKVHIGDKCIIISYAMYDENDLNSYKMRIVHVNNSNKIEEA